MPDYKIALITDSTCDIPQALREQYAINVAPLSIIWGHEQLREGVDIQPDEFYARLVADPTYPTTSQPTPQDFLHLYQQAQHDGAQEIVAITISSAMSGTYESARLASTMIDTPVHLVDSKSNSMSLGWQVLAAARAREAGGDVGAMVAAADAARKSMVYIITLDTLEYLRKGGRIGGASAFIGTLLNFKPQILVNHQTGMVEAGRRTRTRQKAIQALYDDFFAQLDTRKKMHIAVLHNAALPEAEAMAARVQVEFAPAELIISIVSPVLGVHTGPRAIALCGYTDN
ncbi:MAG TPA: DegV family protein [Anaerolineae bacterium]|nr:DegV family protein [Anaerolineae bacterium]HQI85142.1 DegV family protein [Anaerolineae bacterium]